MGVTSFHFFMQNMSQKLGTILLVHYHKVESTTERRAILEARFLAIRTIYVARDTGLVITDFKSEVW